MVDCLRGHARQRPDRVAVHYFHHAVTFETLDRQSSALAAGLVALGVRPGDRVAVLLQNEPGAVLAHYAAWKAAAVAVPLNIMFRTRELAYHLRDAGAAALVCQDSDAGWVAGVARDAGVRALLATSPAGAFDAGHPRPGVVAAAPPALPAGVTPVAELLARHRGEDAVRSPDPEALAYLHYTSGTTGPPKGAMITHASLLFNAGTYRRLCGLDHDDVLLGLAPLFHITGTVGHVAAAGLLGVPLVLLHRFQPAEALRQIRARGVTFAVGAITAFLALLADPGFDPSAVATLRKVFTGGAPVSPAAVARWEAAAGSYLHNVWGMTETTSPGTWTALGERAPVDPDSGALAVGRPIPGSELRIVDPDTGATLGPGAVGELLVRGPHLFRGYWGRPGETAHALRDGWLWTGDLARTDAAGWVYWIERRKDLINAAGFKIWPREVEEALLEHPAVAEAAVVGVPDAYRGETVKAVVVLRPGSRATVDAARLVAFCRERLAAYKCPTVVELRDELPRSPQGKVLRYVLRDAPDGTSGRSGP